MLVEERHQRRDRAFVHDDVGIRDQQVATCRRRGHATVHAASVAEVELRHDEHDVLAGQCRQRRTLVTVLHDDDVGDAVGVERVDAVVERLAGVEVDDDRGDVGRDLAHRLAPRAAVTNQPGECRRATPGAPTTRDANFSIERSLRIGRVASGAGSRSAVAIAVANPSPRPRISPM